MPFCAVPVRSRPLRVFAFAMMTVGVAGCSNSARFESGSGPRASSDVTGSINPRPYYAPRNDVAAQPAPSRPAAMPAQISSQPLPAPTQTTAAYRPAPTPEVTGSVNALPPSPATGWTWEGGTPITVGPNENIETIARKHGVPQSALMQANNIRDTARVRPGQRLVIPRYVGAGAAPVAAAAPVAQSVPSRQVASANLKHTVEPGQSLLGIAKRYGKTPAEVAHANHLKPYAKLNAGDQLTIPGGATRVAAAPQAPQVSQVLGTPPRQLSAPVTVTQQSVAPQIAAPRTAPVQSASAEPVASARLASAAPAADPVEPPSTKTAEATGSTMPTFRWPVKGRVIAGFGAKTGGQNNDGINLAVPEGTPVKAAEDGVVAYSGSELKGYGNLVLVRHANGYVSAYAHASELMVKRGDTIKRGQIIARSGQSGNVTSPQLHFEIRKGSSPVDPTQYLSGG